MAKSAIITGLDIGTSSIKALVALKKPGKSELEVLGQAQAIAEGIRKGVVIDVEEVSRLIQVVLNKVEEQSSQKIDSVYVNVGGSHIFVISSRGTVAVSRADQKISEEDVNRVLQAAQTFSLPSNKEILDVFPREFIVDGEKGIKEVLGMQGVRLEAEVLVSVGFSPYLRNLTQAVLNSNLQISDVIPSPLASSRAVLNPRQKELGVALLDIGAGTSGLCVFEKGDLIHLAIFPIGSADITNDIAIGLKTDIDIAERIKLEFGTCILKGSDKKEKIETEESEPLIFSQRFLSKIIEARVSEIFSQASKELKKISREKLLPAGLVLTGGGAKLPKIEELAKKEFRLPCRIGIPKGVLLQEKDLGLATVCGLVLGGADLEDERNEPFLGTFGRDLGAKIKKIFKIFIP